MDMIEQIKNTVVVLLILGIASVLSAVLEEPLAPLLSFLDAHQSALLAACAVLMIAGFATFMGTAMYILFASRPPSDEGSSTAPPIERSGTVRGKWSASREFYTEASFGAIKEALRSGEWWRDPQWRVLFITALGAIVMSVGLVSLFVVIAPLVVKLIAIAAAIYAAGIAAWGFAHA
jgi:hypothetical protein